MLLDLIASAQKTFGRTQLSSKIFFRLFFVRALSFAISRGEIQMSSMRLVLLIRSGNTLFRSRKLIPISRSIYGTIDIKNI